MSVYVGKDIDTTIQVPVEEDLSSQADGVTTVFTVTNKPISDRDLDGTADEVEHVTVYVNGSEVTVTAVDDDQGQMTLQSAPSQGNTVIIEHRYDLDPEIIQELSLTPREVIEGIDGLGSNKIQAWVPLVKELSGSMKETFAELEQLYRLTKKKKESRYSQQFWTTAALTDFQGDTGNFTVDTQQLLTNSDASSLIGVKNAVSPIWRDGIVSSKMKYVKGDGGLIVRWDGTVYYMYQIYFDYLKKLTVERKTYSAEETLLQTDPLTLPTEFFDFKVKIARNTIEIIVNDEYFSVVDPNPLLTKGMPGYYSLNGLGNRYDDMQAWGEFFPAEYGLILNYTRGSDIVKIGLDGVIFPEGSIPSPKNAPVFITSAFRARKIKFIT